MAGQQTNFRELFDLKIEEQRKSIERALASGGAKDYAEYRQLVGRLQGLEFAANLIDDLAKRLNEDADDE